MIELMESITNIVMGVASLFGAIAVIVQIGTKYNPLNPIRNWLTQPAILKIEQMDLKNTEGHNELAYKINLHSEALEDMYIKDLKDIICNPNLPLTERVNAGKIYVEDKGLNGEVKSRYKVLRDMLEEELKKGGKL